MLNIVLYEPEIPANTGNIMRTCMAFNMRLHLIEPLGFKLEDKYLKRAGMDYILQTDYTVYKNWDEFLDKNSGSMYFITRYGNKRPTDFNYRKDWEAGREIYLVFGKESTGIAKYILQKNLDRCIRIPMVPNARSLNLSNCVALTAFIVLVQLGYPNLSRTEVQKGEDFLRNYHGED